MTDAATIETDVLVVGGGPAGSSVAIRLAGAGHSVALIEKRPTPRLKACGDTLTPRALADVGDLGVDTAALGGHRVAGVEIRHGRRVVPTPWPTHPDHPADGLVVRRDAFDEHLRRRAAAAGATVLAGHEATVPIIERGFVRGAHVQLAEGGGRDMRARFVVVADGASSRFGRVLGTSRDPRWPYAIATRTYFASELSDREWIEVTLGLAEANDGPTAGYGWVAPEGDGTVNVGVGVLSSARDIRSINARKLLDRFAETIAQRWHLDAGAPLKAPTRLRVPLGGSVSPKMGPTFLVVGDAAGAASPFDGVGIDAALVTGRLAAAALDEALVTGSAAGLQRYPTMLADELGRYQKVGRLTARFIGRPMVLRPLLRLATRSHALMGGMLRIAGNEMRTVDAGAAERTYTVAAALSRLAPNW